jgi:quercetin dioxygenase-like cupin family protein
VAERTRDSNAVDRGAVEKNWRERGFSCGLWVDPPGQIWADYVHATDELVMVVEGDVEFEIDGRAHRPSPSEEIFIPARARHTVRNLGRGESRWCTATGDDDEPR